MKVGGGLGEKLGERVVKAWVRVVVRGWGLM
jgi:hypothetical protein